MLLQSILYPQSANGCSDVKVAFSATDFFQKSVPAVPCLLVFRRAKPGIRSDENIEGGTEMRCTGALADTRGSRGPGWRWQGLELKWKKQCPGLGSRKTKCRAHCVGTFSRDELGACVSCRSW